MATLVSVIIPVYNEESLVGDVLRQILSIRPGLAVELEIIVIDDGSKDRTAVILKEFNEIKVIEQEKNRGKGAAIREGLKHAKGSIVLIQDADTEYRVSDYPALLQPILEKRARVVYGSRFLGEISGMRLRYRLFNIFIRALTNIFFLSAITDEATAYKVLDAELMRSLNLKSDRFEICPEITAKLLRRGHTIHEVPIGYRARSVKEGKKITWIDGVRAIYTLLKYRIVD